MIYDEELLVKDVEALLKAKLNEEISAINTEKNDELNLDSIPDDKYVFEALDQSLLNFKGFFVMYGIVDTPVTSGNEGSDIIGTVVTISIATFDKGEKERSNIFYKLLRYRRAVRQLIKKNPDVFRGYAKPVIASLKPNAFPFGNDKIVLTVGIDVKASMTAD